MLDLTLKLATAAVTIAALITTIRGALHTRAIRYNDLSAWRTNGAVPEDLAEGVVHLWAQDNESSHVRVREGRRRMGS